MSMIIPKKDRSSLPLSGKEVLTHPDMKKAFNYIVSEYSAPKKDICIFLTCSVAKPYHESPTHKRFDRVIFSLVPEEKVHIVVFGTCGVVPRELDLEYPFMEYKFVLGKADDQTKKEFIPNEAKKISTYLEKNHSKYSQIFAYCLGEFRQSMELAKKMTHLPIEILPYDKTLEAHYNPKLKFPYGSLLKEEYLQDLANALADATNVPRKKVCRKLVEDPDEIEVFVE